MILLAAYLLMALIILAADWWVCRRDEEEQREQFLRDELVTAAVEFLREPNRQTRHRFERAIEELS